MHEVNNEWMRQFLLGDLTEEKREEVEQLVLSESETREKLSMAEDDLIEDYLEGSLTEEDSQKFLNQFLAIPHQRNKLRLAKSLRRVAKEDLRPATQPVKVEAKPTVSIDEFKERKRRSLLRYAPIAAVVIVAFVLGIVLFANYRRNVAREARRAAIESELGELNARGQDLPSDQKLILIVPPVTTRSVVANVSPNFKGPLLELWLLPNNKGVAKYSALLQKIGSEDQYEIRDLQLQDHGASKAVRLWIPINFVQPGSYRVQLRALAPDGRIVDTSEHSFEIQGLVANTSSK
jgi:hypothetical protein